LKLKKDRSENQGFRSYEASKDEIPVAELRTSDYRSFTSDYKEQTSHAVKPLRTSN
jgi:hypothetical protein